MTLLFSDWNLHMWSDPGEILGFVIKLILAMACSAAIGIEREAKHRPAGLRTHIIVCIASTLIMAVGILLKNKYIGDSPNIDPTRLAAQIISGIGFLGAGTIIKGRDTVFGLTTAATLWSVACIGITVGSGYYLEAIAATLCILLVLRVINFLETYYQKKHSRYVVSMYIDGPIDNLKNLSMVLDYSNITVDYIHLKGINDVKGMELMSVEVGLRIKGSAHERRFDPVDFFENYDFVRSIYDVRYPEVLKQGSR